MSEKDPNLMEGTIGASSSSQVPIKMDKYLGVKEIHQEWIRKLTNVSIPPPPKPRGHVPKKPKDTRKRREQGRKHGNSDSERRAVKEYCTDQERSDLQIEAFLEGFRMKQDYLALSMESQIDQLTKLVDTLTSATTSISRASCDLVEAIASSTAKLDSSVTTYIDKGKAAQDQLKKDGESKFTHQDLAKVMGASVPKLKGFYEVDDQAILEVINSVPGSLESMKKEKGGLLALKGKIKKALSEFAK